MEEATRKQGPSTDCNFSEGWIRKILAPALGTDQQAHLSQARRLEELVSVARLHSYFVLTVTLPMWLKKPDAALTSKARRTILINQYLSVVVESKSVDQC